MRRIQAGLWIVACGLLLALPGIAQAEFSYQGSFGSAGSGAGQFSRPAGISVNNATGDLYVADRDQHRVEQFDETGKFIRAWGFDVVASGEDDEPAANESQKIVIKADSGTFTLTFEGSTTSLISFNATPAEVESALNLLPTVSAGGGSVTVTGGPGDATGSSLYQVAFTAGPLAGVDDPGLTVDQTGLGMPSGTQLTCVGGPFLESFFSPIPPESFDYQWLSNGTPIPGATSTQFTPALAQAGEAIQCRVTAKYKQISTIQTDRFYHVPSPVGSLPNPPLGVVPPPTPNEPLALGSPGGQVLTCNAGNWTDSPYEYAYSWYRNGQQVGTSTTTPASNSQYTTTEADVASRSMFQCSVTATNASGASTRFSGLTETSPGLTPPKPTLAESTVTASVASRAYTATNGGAVFELCVANPPSDDVCKAGVAGGALGQFSSPRGIVVDNSSGGAADVYVLDDKNFRVEKFSSAGTPIMTYGKEVNLTTGGDLCSVPSGQDCGPGLINETLAPGQFSGWSEQLGSNYSELGNELAVDDAGNVYVGDGRDGQFDKNKARIQKFSPAGAYLAQVRIPTNAVNVGFFPRPLGVGVNSQGQVFAAVTAQPSVEMFEPSEFGFADTGPEYPDRFTFHENESAAQLAISPTDDKVWISDRNLGNRHVCGEAGSERRALLAYDAEGNRLFCTAPTGAGELPEATGLAISPSGKKAYVSVGSENTVKIFNLPEPQPPVVTSQAANSITTETARLGAQVNPGFDRTSFKFQFGAAPCSTNPCAVYTGDVAINGVGDRTVEVPVGGLKPNTTYHFRVLTENASGQDVGEDRTFTTFPFVDLLNDSCPNALARKQTKTAGLDDCRAYELASADFTGGYDVESDLVAGQEPLLAYPQADGKVLYAVHSGGVPDTGSPTNRGPDPYVAVRGEKRWTTTYVGIPADGGFSVAPFSSTLAEADSQLETLAFSGPEICSPCFADGSNGIPVHMPNGDLAQGMKGSIAQPTAKPVGHVGKVLSADGHHLVFGSTARFESPGNEGGVSIYERDLQAGTTEVVSTMPNGQTMSAEVGELDISANGDRILIATKVSTDSAGNDYWHPYLHRSGSPNSIDLSSNISAGVAFAGMTRDGSKVFFTTTDKLTGADGDAGADLYEADIDGAGAVSLTLISAGSVPPVGNGNECDPVANTDGNNWNAVGVSSLDGCGVLAIAGGGGLAADDGTIYFLSPEKLDGSGAPNEPNLFVARPGEPPVFVTTLEPDNPIVRHALTDSEVHRYGDFQVTPTGDFAAFATPLALRADYDNAGFDEVYRYDASNEALTCVSCNPTEGRAGSDAALPGYGLGLLADGRTFFNTGDQLVLRDTNGRLDAYEWQKGAPQLISTGNSLYGSGLLSVTEDGRDVFFFTRDQLVPNDVNGQTMKIYDAREQGGFFVVPVAPPCAASDECHGPGSQPSPPPPIGSIEGTGGQFNELICKKGQVKRHGRCASKPKHRKPKHRKPKHRKPKRGGRR